MSLYERWNALPDELANIIRDYARQPTPQERMTRLYLSPNRKRDTKTYYQLLLNITKSHLLRQIEQPTLFTVSKNSLNTNSLGLFRAWYDSNGYFLF